MQIIEVTEFGVRSAVIRLRRRDSALQFVLYPMIHMAKPAFYTAVTTRLKGADVVVVEGVGGGQRKRSVLVGALTLSYTVLRFNRRAKLVEQDIDYVALGVPVIRPDVSVEDFAASWRRVPLSHRLMMWCALPFIVVTRLLGGTRMIWSRSMEQNDLPSAAEEDLADWSPRLEAAFGGERDNRLLSALCRLHEERSGENIEVAVVYGAAHAPAIVHGLTKRYGYRPRSAEWLTVADV
ncbi:hypothetical protein FB565_007127 [Actinoplanes lutulentus]|uniref:Uncharacterized protein n=1 Tax=Actinoplanes lutulentus TaxID=1287878 RepID=A0A327ZGH4_9ACTN|nr:hypothetical protein [Actinoplanes lutulentus]MBB2947359.1 hypothetical protein [Actinoplanes lutulentus]RAK36634.1 hypothetical protein B0I29_108224 [Actinoplanes lutulentus]